VKKEAKLARINTQTVLPDAKANTLLKKATGVKTKLARIFKSLRHCLAKKKKGLIQNLVKSATRSRS